MKTNIDFIPYKGFQITSTSKGEMKRDLTWLYKKAIKVYGKNSLEATVLYEILDEMNRDAQDMLKEAK